MALDLLDQILPHVRNSIYRHRLPLPDWKMKEGEVERAAQPGLNDKSWTPIRIPFQWGKYDKTYWFRQHVELPHAFAGKPTALLLDFPEALVYVNGKPHQGVDKHHAEVLLSVRPKSLEAFHIAVEAYSGRKKEPDTFSQAELAVVDGTARKLYHGLTILRELEKMFDHASQEAKDIREIIRRTLIYVKWYAPESEAYPEQIGRAYQAMQMMLDTEYRSTLPGVVHLIGHSHIDIAWLWTFKETARKCGRTFSAILRLMDEYPDFKFSQSQAYLYHLVQEHYPDLYKQIKQRVAEGRWEPVGSMWVEPDCNIPNGESLVRQILHGKRFFKQEFGIDSTVAWLPDTFGYSWALPQILKKFGINAFYTSKLTWNDTNKFPYTTFWWEGIDGTRILSHMSPVGLEGLVTPKDIRKSGAVLEPGGPVSAVLQTYGYGDGGGGVSQEHLDCASVLRSATGLTPSKFSTASEFFKEIEQANAELPVWSNELYLEKHRGTLTTQAWVKKANRQGEVSLYTAELTSSIAMFCCKHSPAKRYPSAELDRLWKTLLLMQFHDIVPGTSIKDVYTEVQARYADLQARSSALINRSLEACTSTVRATAKEFAFSVFNPLQWTRSEYVEVSVKTKKKFVTVADAVGRPVEYQVLERAKDSLRLLCYIPSIPGFGFASFVVTPVDRRATEPQPWKSTAHAFETPFFRVRLDSKGGFSSIYDKTRRREVVQKGKRGNLFQAFQDKPKQWEAWDIDADTEKHKLEILEFKHAKLTEQGPLRLTLRIEFRTPTRSVITQDVHFYHRSPRVDFATHVKWQEKLTLLKVAFPLAVKTNSATYEMQFGAIRRPTKSSDPWERAKFEVPAQQWADMSESKYGVAILNDCKYGYDAKESVLRLTLLRSPHYPHPIEPWHLNDAEVTDQGEHRFCYSIYPHAGDWRNGLVTQRARELNHPVTVLAGRTPALKSTLLTISKPSVVVDAVKKAEEGDELVLRLHEAYGLPADATIQFGADCKSAFECDLQENTVKELKASKSKLAVRFKPFEIKTLKVTLRVKEH